MAKKFRGKPGRNSIPDDFSWRTIDMLRSPAYRCLSLSARKILDRLEIELYQHGGNPFDNGAGLPCTYDHFEEYGVHRHSIGPAIRELAALGFLQVIQPGCAGNANERQPAKYRLTYRRAYSNHQITDEWRRFETIEEAAAAARCARERRVAPARVRRAPKNKTPVAVSAPHPVVETAPHPVMESALQPQQSPSGGKRTTSICRGLQPNNDDAGLDPVRAPVDAVTADGARPSQARPNGSAVLTPAAARRGLQ